MGTGDEQLFSAYFEVVEPRLRSALVASFGPENGRDAAATALAWAWRNWDRLQLMDNPDGYLYRVGRSHALREVKARRRVHPPGRIENETAEGDYEPALTAYLAALPEQQRVCVWMVHGLGYTLADTAALVGCSRSSVATHVRRALMRLRAGLEVEPR